MDRASEFPSPEFRLARVTMTAQGRINRIEGGLHHLMLRIVGQIGTHHARESPAGPGPPATLFTARLVHAVGVVLKMNPRIPEKNIAGCGVGLNSAVLPPVQALSFPLEPATA